MSSSPQVSSSISTSNNGYTLAIIGCGTMGIAILSGMLDSKKANEAKRAASVALSSSCSHSAATPLPPPMSTSNNSNGFSNDLSASIASLLEIDDDENDSSSSDQKKIQLPSQFIACVSRVESAKKLRKTFSDYTTTFNSSIVQVVSGDNLTSVKQADVILLACKPQMVKEILSEKGIKEAIRGKLVCSICAGLTIKSIQQCLFEDTTVVRAMPNTPSKIRQGMTILTPLPNHDSNSNTSRNRLLSIFSAIGKCRILDEKHFDAATALAGSGPAFVCVFLEAMVDGAVMMGLPRTEAVELAAQSELQ